MDVNVHGQKVIITCGDSRAAAHAVNLLNEGANVTVITPAVVATIEDLAARHLLVWHARMVTATDIEDAFLVFGNAPQPAGQGSAPASEPGSVTLVGGGPGDAGLITLAGRAAIETADVIIADRLCPTAALAWARPDAEIIDAGKIPGGRSTSQDEINQTLIDRAKNGYRVVRLKGGDSFVFGRGGEELLACAEAGVSTHIIPGVSSALAAPACAGIPLTHRGLTQGFTVVSGHVAPGDPASTVDWSALARSGTTVVILMGVGTLSRIAETLISARMDPSTPATMIADGGMVSQRVVSADLQTIAQAADEADIGPPAVTVIGAVADLDLLGLGARSVHNAHSAATRPAYLPS